MQFSSESPRRAAVRVLRPWLGSARLVCLFYRIGMLHGQRPGAIATIELFVDRMTKPRNVAAALHTKDRQRSVG